MSSNHPILFIIPGACAFGSQVTLEWLGIPYQIGITTPEIRSSENFRKINPTGKVGALKDGDNVVGENLAILLYLADKFSDRNLAGKIGSVERIKVYQWLSYLSSTLHPAFSQNIYAERFIDENGLVVFKQLAYTRLVGVLEYIDDQLCNNNGIFVGDDLTIVDAQAFGLLRWTRINNKGINLVDLTKFPNIIKFLDKMQDLPMVKNALAIEANKLEDLGKSNFAGYFKF